MRWSVLLFLTIALPALGTDETVAELEDAERRTGAELRTRIHDLERMVNTLQRLSREQNEYIRMLKRRIEALREQEGVKQ